MLEECIKKIVKMYFLEGMTTTEAAELVKNECIKNSGNCECTHCEFRNNTK